MSRDQREYKKRWCKENPDKVRAYKQKYTEANQERVRDAARKRHDPERARERYLLRKYGITQEQYDEMARRQQGTCAICEHAPVDRPLHVDHDHDTGRVRGLLCMRCNTNLGWYETRSEAVGEYLAPA